jgi:hypothetical protein
MKRYPNRIAGDFFFEARAGKRALLTPHPLFSSKDKLN